MNGPAGKDVLNSIERLQDCQRTQRRNKLILYSTAWEKKQRLFSHQLAYHREIGKSMKESAES